MEEQAYRASRLLRALGSPVRYSIVKELENRKMTPGELSASLRRKVSTISDHLQVLRSLDIVRYEGRSGKVLYWLKYGDILGILNTAEKCVSKMKLETSALR
ncbi:MAG: hypothetical protein COX49_10320 [bacterium (Candidatus Stahlbacteria) CG23_combo_of_CG06-09_8_20_14_all_40_9]|nr:MAG: hypothetical protein COX49_10320 [bacterium (Candidatus Stahlbacteria) CG23_combo_of_CG06-09_8_20_14_all_40_9]